MVARLDGFTEPGAIAAVNSGLPVGDGSAQPGQPFRAI